MPIKWSIETHLSLPSTQDYLRGIILNNSDVSAGTVIHAIHQTNGYGRHGRVWSESDGNLFVSFLIRPRCRVSCVGHISLLTGLSALRSIMLYTPPDIDLKLKWPNDILIQNKKCGGILIESAPIIDSHIDYFIIGIGININTAPIDQSSCIKDYTNNTLTAEGFLKTLLAKFSEYYDIWIHDGFEPLRQQWIDHAFDIGTAMSVKLGDQIISGNFEGIDSDGNLLLTCHDTGKVRKITSGDVFLLSCA